ncbi:unnamed protein product [Phytophthora lilii]|uniref:Unnamed protein product n=1 Tax=Phytophthora lilii TaxID=2077276 RepID=A0A9W6WYD3_9STRA|nr:unnamed protein product [Phytophthora lilii]
MIAPIRFIQFCSARYVVLTEQRRSKHIAKDTRRLPVRTRKSTLKAKAKRRKWWSCQHYQPEFEMSENKLLELYDRVAKWPDVMLQTTREIINAEAASQAYHETISNVNVCTFETPFNPHLICIDKSICCTTDDYNVFALNVLLETFYHFLSAHLSIDWPFPLFLTGSHRRGEEAPDAAAGAEEKVGATPGAAPQRSSSASRRREGQQFPPRCNTWPTTGCGRCSVSAGWHAVREDYDTVDDGTSIWNYRLLSTDSHGITSEVNKVVLTEYFDESEQVGGRACAVVVTDSVDVDDLYSYDPRERVRRDISATTVLTEMRRKKHKKSITTETENNVPGKKADQDGAEADENEEEVVVVMQRAAFMKMHKPGFEISRSAMRSLKEGIASWGEVEVQSIRGAVNA